MIHRDELAALERRAHAARITMPKLCELAGKHPSSWYRARARGRAEIKLIDPLERAMLAYEQDRKS